MASTPKQRKLDERAAFSARFGVNHEARALCRVYASLSR